jgi:hypothetical protein
MPTIWRRLGILVLLPIVAGADEAHASIHLVGAQQYLATGSTGAVSGGTQFTTNSNSGVISLATLNVTGASLTDTDPGMGISFLLNLGDNVFIADHALDNFEWTGLNLFFSASSGSYNPAVGSTLIDEMLTVVGTYGVTAPPPVAAGASILSYSAGGFSGVPTIAANEEPFLLIDGYTVTVTSVNFVESSGRSFFTVNVSAVPEAGSLAIWGAMVASAVTWQRWRSAAAA